MRKTLAGILIILAVLMEIFYTPQPVGANDANIVVVTPKGKKYHYPSCRTVRGKYTQLTIAQAFKRGYKPCKVCEPPSSPITNTPDTNFEVYGN